MCLTPSHCSRAILALQVVGDKPLTSWSVVSLGTQHTQAPTPPQTSAHVVRPLEIAPATRAKFVLLRERPVLPLPDSPLPSDYNSTAVLNVCKVVAGRSVPKC